MNLLIIKKFLEVIILSALICFIPMRGVLTYQNNIVPYQVVLTSQEKSLTKHSPIPRVTKYNYENFWYKSTFPTKKASIAYHTKKHGHGRTPLHYTRDAVYFYEKNKFLRQPIILKDGTLGYKIKKGDKGGTWTKSGKIVTFWG